MTSQPCYILNCEFISLSDFIGGVVNVNGRKLCPRIILMTDGKPTDQNGRETDEVRMSPAKRFQNHSTLSNSTLLNNVNTLLNVVDKRQ